MTDCHFIDTHAHLDGEEFKDDLPQVIRRAKDAGWRQSSFPVSTLPPWRA